MNEETSKIAKKAIRRNRSGYRVAQLMDVKPDTVYAWRDGKTSPQGRHLMRLIELAGKSLAVAAMTTAALLSAVGNDANAASFDNRQITRSGNPIYTLCELARWIATKVTSLVDSLSCRLSPA